MKMLKRLLSIVLVLMMLIPMGIGGNVFAESTETGTWGSNLTWSYDGAGTLVISGNGEMHEEPFNMPWAHLKDEVKNLVVEDGVTSISNLAFSEFGALENISFSDTVTTLRAHAFNSCTALKEVVLPDSVTEINDAFINCSGLENIVLSDNISVIRQTAFQNCTSLKSIVLPKSLTLIRDLAFLNCTSLKAVVIPAGVTKMEMGVFSGCTSLKYVVIPESVTEITTNSLDKWPDCTIVCLPGSYAESFAKKNAVKYTLPEYTNSDERSISGSCGENLTWVFDNEGVLTIFGEGRMYDYYIESEDAVPWFSVCNFVEKAVVESGVTYICRDAFRYHNNLTEVIIADSVTEIDRTVFHGCDSLEKVVLPSGITELSEYMFAYCTSLKSIDIPDSVTTIGGHAFMECPVLEEVYIPDSVTFIGNSAFEECDGLKFIHIPNSVTEFDHKAFLGSDNLTFICEPGSPAENYAIYYGIPYRSDRFVDVSAGKWYTDGILRCAEKGYMAGMSDDVFGYKETVTRAMFATILAKIDGAELSEYSEMSFTDVPAGQWYSAAIEWAYRNEYAAGLGEGIFGRKSPVTREQLAMFLYTYSEKNGISVTRRADLTGFADYDRIHAYALDALSWAVKVGLISGTGDTTLAPRNSATRAEIALIIKNYVEGVKDAEIIEAGTDSELTRDGTPKKYFTLSFDDGITQDARIIEILKKYDVDCCTFNINTGLYGVSWPAVGVSLGRPDITHIRYTEEELMTGIYDGYDVEVHTLHHPALGDYDNDPASIINEVAGDAANIEKITGYTPVGMAWPGGDDFYTDTTIDIIMENTDIRFARGTTSTFGFKLPEYFMRWLPTCSVSDPLLLEYAKTFLRTPCEEDMLFYVWGHGYEFDFYHSYDTFEALIKMISEADDVVLVTNAEFYQLFKDEIPSWK